MKIERLRCLLHDPITGDEAQALLDVLSGTRRIQDLLEWLEGEPTAWLEFLVNRETKGLEAARSRKAGARRPGEEWPAVERIDELFDVTPGGEREPRSFVEAKKQFLGQAKPCPRCGTPPEQLEWQWFSSPPITWANLCGRAGWKTRCKTCSRQVDFFLTVLN
jgi:hypothetical protein